MSDQKNKGVFELKPVEPVVEVNNDAVECLEFILADVKAGRITEVGFAYVTTEGVMGFGFSEGSQGGLLLAACCHLQRAAAEI